MLTIRELDRRFIDFPSLTTALHYSTAMELSYSELCLFNLPVMLPFSPLLFHFLFLPYTLKSCLLSTYYFFSSPYLFNLPLSPNIPVINLFTVTISLRFTPFVHTFLFISHSISLLLPVPAMITSHPNTTMAKKGHVKELNCTARGEWPIIIRWERGDTVIDPDRNPRYSITTSPNEKTDEVLSTLKVKNTYIVEHVVDENRQQCVCDSHLFDK